MNIHERLQELSSADVAELLGCTDRAVRQWAAAGMPHRQQGKDLRFSWREVLPWWAENRFRGSVRLPGGVPSKAEAEARLLAIKAEMAQARLDVEQGRLLEAEQVEHTWARVLVGLRARLLAIPSRLRGPLGREVAAKVEDEVRLALTELAGMEVEP